MKNGETSESNGISIEAIPMYNITRDRLRYHEKGRGNGYVLTLGDKRVYISGDTEDIPEMRVLKDIDVAFICMNLPYTMTVDQAADAVKEFKPGIVYPYHYRGVMCRHFRRWWNQIRSRCSPSGLVSGAVISEFSHLQYEGAEQC